MANMQELLSQRFEARKQKLVSMDIVAVAESLGMKLKPGSSGTYYWEEHDSFHIYPNTNTFRWWSRSIGSNTIDLVQVVREELTGQKPNFKEAAAFLETGQFENVTVQPPVKEPFEYYLERYEHSDFNIGRQYLKEERGLSDETIDTFLASGNLATATRKKGDYFEPVIVFKSRDNDGKMIGASLQGIVENRVQHPERGRLKQIMKNSDGTAGFSLDIGNPKRLVFAEAPIDLMSYYELHKDDLQDVKLVAMDGMKKSVISRYVADMLTDGKYSQTMSNEQIRGALDALNKTTNILQEHPDMITLAVDNDEAGQNFVKGLQEDGIPVVSDLPPRKESQTKMDWNDYLKQEAKPKKSTADETWNIDDIQEQLSQESDLVGTQAVDVIYMNEVYLNQGYSLSLAIHSNEEVENLTDVAAPWTLEVMRNGQSLGYLAYGEDWGNDFDIEDELVNLENWVKDNQVTNHLYTQKDVNAFLATTQAVEPQKGEFVLKGGGIYDFGESQKEGEELRQRALDGMIADITDGETYYLWHDEELENLNAPDEAFINFHYHLKDIEYNQDNIHLYVEESSTDGVTGYLSLDGNSLDSDSIEEYLADQDWTFDQKVQFLKNLKTAVDETWDKVTNHYNEQFEAIVAQYGLSNKKEKSLEKIQEMITSNSEQQKKVENPIEDLPEQSQEAAPLPSTHEEYSLNESSPTQTQSQPLLHFTISDPERSIYKLGYHPVNKKELNKLNRYAAQIQENATWYKNELADSNVTYFYKNNDNLEALKVTFKAEQYPHLVGIFAIDDDQSATKTLDDLASGKGDYQNIMVANRGATFSKIQVLPDFKAVIDSNSFIFDDLSEVERMNRLDLAKAIRTEDKDVLIAFRNVDGEYLPASLMKVTNKLESELSMANNKDVLGIIGEKDGEFKILSVNEEVIKDGGEKMLSIVKNGQLEDLSNTVPKAEWVIEFNETNLSGNVEIPSFTGAGLTEELLERIKDYDYRLYLASLNGEGEGYYKFYFNKIQDNKVVQQERLDVGDGLERNEEIYKFLEQELAPEKAVKVAERELTAEDFSKVLDAVYNVGARVGKDNRKNISENLYPAWDKYFEYAERYDNNFDVIVKAARADNLLDENSDFYKEVWLKKIQEENQKVKDSDDFELQVTIEPWQVQQLTSQSINVNPLERLDAVMDWQLFLPLLSELFSRKNKVIGRGGRPHLDYLMMFKVLLLQRLHNLSDDAMEYQLLDRLSFRRFVGCHEDNVPDSKTIWLYRDRLTQSGREKELFDLFYTQLSDEGLIAHTGQIVDASFVECPKQRNSREENEKIKAHETVEGWNKAKRCQKDIDGSWTQKGGVRYFGYKNHVCVDRKSKLIKDYGVTTASIHDSNVLASLCDANEPVFDDSAYVGKSVPDNCQHHTVRRAFRNKPLTDTDKNINRHIAKVRCRVEHVFGFIENSMKGSTFRGIGMDRAKTNVTLTNLLYNIFRFEQIKRLGLKSWA